MKTVITGLLSLMVSGIVYGAEEIPYLSNEYDPERWPVAKLKLSTAATLKDVFDSGLRPYRFPFLEKTTLELKHLNLSIHLGSRKKLPPIAAEMMRIKPFSDGEIATIEGFTPKLTLEQARLEMLKWLPYAENERTTKDLDDYLKAVAADYLDFDDPYGEFAHGCGISWNEPGFRELKGGPRCGFGFRKTASATNPLRLYFSLSWGLNRPPKDATYYKTPIPPPPGYEHVSMEAPEKFGPDSMVDILRSQGIDIGESEEAIRESNQAKSQISDEALQKHSDATRDGFDDKNPAKHFSALWLSLGIFLFILLVLYYFLRKSMQET